MKLYYSHAMPLYGTIIEKNEKKQILETIPFVEIVDPGSYQDNPEKRLGGMNYCLKLVDECDAVAFSRFKGEITAGVGKEVNYAISRNVPVYEIKEGKLINVKEPVEHLSLLETLELPGYRKY